MPLDSLDLNINQIPNGIEYIHNNINDIGLFEHLGDVQKVPLQYFNEDKDLQCLVCGKIIVLQIRRQYDSRSGKIRDNKKKGGGRNLDGNSEMVGEFLRSVRPSHHDSEMVRQRRKRTRRRNLGFFG